MIFRVSNLSKSYDKNTVVNSISFDVNESDYVAIVGPSGSGKTTLLSLLTGMLKPSSGEVIFNNEKLSTFSNSKLLKFRSNEIGLIFQFSELIPNLTIRENILLPTLFSKKYDSTEYEKKCDYLLYMLELTKFADKLPRKLSGGQIQKAAIARSLINNPEILFADEPSGDLDPENSGLVRNLFRDYNQKGLTILLVTHDMKLAFDAKTIYEMRDGQFTKVIK
ncbi:MAG: ABC transporter ATP-binding protein [Leptospiraceae bacterium]|nr:ABC transporter ATP-binding protein [Leptospiraceae bacterium]MCK6381277.1 ABC transporter ATP-binding protein [Leptospiraceae bacterium]NUM40410.1 ABC transporter ATP-binding protein [Leptospiraceae bacterium]